jgi:DNA replication protein DnaC
LLFEVPSQGYERGSMIGTGHLPFDEWTSVLGSDHLTHHVHILEMNGESCRLAHARRRARRARPDNPPDDTSHG